MAPAILNLNAFNKFLVYYKPRRDVLLTVYRRLTEKSDDSNTSRLSHKTSHRFIKRRNVHVFHEFTPPR